MLRRGLLLDRDGVINEDRGYVGSRAEFAFMPGLFPFLRAAQDTGYRLAILTNQSGVGRGLYTETDFNVLTDWMLKEMATQGVSIDLVLACFTHPEAKLAEYRRESFWRKPNPGMVLEAVQRLNLDPACSVFFGDSARDMEAAQKGGIKNRLYMSGKEKTAPEGAVLIGNYDEALRILRGF